MRIHRSTISKSSNQHGNIDGTRQVVEKASLIIKQLRAEVHYCNKLKHSFGDEIGVDTMNWFQQKDAEYIKTLCKSHGLKKM